LLLTAGMARAQQTLTVPAELVQFPDLIIHNAKIVTMDDTTPMGPPGNIFQAMAIRGDLIQFLGTNAQVLRYVGPRTRKIDLKGRTVVPGLIDTHTHLHDGFISSWARQHPEEVMNFRKGFSVTGNTYQELTKGIELAIKEGMSGAPQEQWATVTLPGGGPQGLGIGTRYLKEEQMTRPQLDQWAPSRPVYVSTSDGEFLFNTAARDAYMKLFEVEPTDENEMGTLDVNPQVGRTLIVEQYFRTRVPLLADILENGLRYFAALGFTGFSSHIVGYPIHDAYIKLAREERMPVRFGFSHRFCQVMAVDIPGCFARLGDMAGMGNKYFWNVGVTLGALDFDAPSFCTTMDATADVKATEKCNSDPGTPYYEAIYTALRSHLRYAVNHVMGDKSMDNFLDLIERAMKDDPSMDLDYVRGRKYSADHCGWYPRQDQIPRLAKLGVHLSCGPKEIDDQGAYIPSFYGERYANRIGPVQSMLRGGLNVSTEGGQQVVPKLGPNDENWTIFARYFPYMTRKRSDGVALAPEEAINRVQLMKTATSWAAAYMLKEKDLGTLQAGKFADFVVFNKDYFTIPENDIPTVFPLMVVMGGKTIVLREELARELGTAAVGPQLKFTFEIPQARPGGGD
jgi:predicted amidohydrolase YtcJ